MTATLSDRLSAAFRLTDRLWHLRGNDALLMAVDRGGITIGSVLAQLLGFPLEFLFETAGLSGKVAEKETTSSGPPKMAGPTSSARQGQTLIVVDDGMATETQLEAALRHARTRQPALLILALSAAMPAATAAHLRTMADAVIYLQSPPHAKAVQECYKKLPPMNDAEVNAAIRVANC